MVPSSEPIEQALTILGYNRVLYGSDEPVNMARWVEYFHPELGTRSIPSYRYHWVDADSWTRFHHLADGAVHNHWQVLAAIKTAIERAYPRQTDKIKESLFAANASIDFLSSIDGQASFSGIRTLPDILKNPTIHQA